MGCFLGCFGFTKKRKRRKSTNKIIYDHQSYGRYVPLDSVKLDIIEMPDQEISDKKLSDEPKESSTSKIRKKVSFNLNIRTYEPLPNEDNYDNYLSEEEEKTMWEYNHHQEEEKDETSILQFEEDSIVGSYPANYRYKNCRYSYDKEAEIELEESDFDDDDDDYLDSDEEEDDTSTQKLDSAGKKCNLDQLQDSVHEEKNRMKSSKSARNRSRNVYYSVLNPVENLTQWKEMKAKSRQQQSKNQKENIVSEQDQRVISHMKKNSKPNAVDASLSNWLS